MKQLLLTLIIITILSIKINAQGWIAVEFPLEENINGISFVHPDTAFVVTKTGKLVRTFDTGKTWDIFNAAPGISLEDVHFINSDIGFICGGK
ncbi:MAG: YCF48-related protein, partial [Candidatus Zixiibacteriota bacterium]